MPRKNISVDIENDFAIEQIIIEDKKNDGEMVLLAEKELKEAHPDFDEIRMDKGFHECQIHSSPVQNIEDARGPARRHTAATRRGTVARSHIGERATPPRTRERTQGR